MGSATVTAVSDFFLVIGDEERDDRGIVIFRVPDYIKVASPEHFHPMELRLGLYTHRSLETAPGGMDSFKVTVARALARGPGSSPTAACSPTDHMESKTWEDFCKALDLEKAEAAYDAFQPRYPISEESGESVGKRHPPRVVLAVDALFLCAYLRSTLEWECWGYPFKHIFRDSRFEARRYPLYRDLLIVENQVPMSLLLAVIRQLCKAESSLKQVSFTSTDDVDSVAQEALNNLLLQVVAAVYPFNHGVELELGTDVLEKHLAKHFSAQSPDALWKCNHILAAAYLAICGGYNPRPLEESVPRTWPKWMPLSREGGGKDNPQEGIRNRYRVPPATSLRQLGVSFKVCGHALTLEGIEFDRRSNTLLLPKLIMNDHTAAQFRNLALYEQLQIKGNVRADLRTYLYLMSCLVDNAEDVRLLTKCGIIVNQLSNDKAVSQHWNGMCEGLFIPSNPPQYWGTLQKSVSKLERAKAKEWFGDFRVRHCANPLRGLTVIAIFFITVSTVLQAIMAMVAYWKPPDR